VYQSLWNTYLMLRDKRFLADPRYLLGGVLAGVGAWYGGLVLGLPLVAYLSTRSAAPTKDEVPATA
jgi:hypothetical protein